jgi:hypothetical protein
MKKCTKCEIEKEECEFFFKNKEKNILHSYCKTCKREFDRKIYHDDKHDRKKKIRQRANNTNKEVKEFYKEYKKKSKCSICGDDRWYVLDFHHKDNKKNLISILARRGSLRLLKEELEKCIPVCANCHREIHYNEGKWE